jgi:glucose/arabinose dehydrogenase
MIGMGDGGGSNGQYGTSRDNKSPLAKILRIDVEADGKPDSNKACGNCPMVDGFDFTVPADNPFATDPDYAPEVWATGVRNPWRFSIDPVTDTMYIADVGQGNYEEVSIGKVGADLGWNIMEGNNCFKGAPCDTSAAPNGVNKDGMTAPLTEYTHDDNGRCSITGAHVYHSCEVPAWDGVYFYSDYCSAEVFALKWDGSTVTELDVVTNTNGEPIIGSGYNGYGDVIINTVVVNGLNQLMDGKIYRIVPGA